MGSGGNYVGYEVAKALGFAYVNREILYRAADILKRSAASLEQYEEKSSGFIQNLIMTFAFGSPDIPYVPLTARPVYDRELFDLESKIITDIADKHSAVIIGRAGFHVLKGRANTTHLFFHAPYEHRVKRIMKARNIADIQKAQTEIEESDKRRGKFIRDMTGTEWTDALNYHFCIDTMSASLSDIVKTVIDFLEKSLLRQET
jgi:cytidylate kinase